MKRIFFIAIFIAIGAIAALSARTIRDFFTGEPDNIFMLLDKSTRLDLLDYYDNGRIVSAKNNLGSDSQLISVTPTHLAIRMASGSTVEMQMLTKGKRDTVIAVISSVTLPAPDSRIEFYSTKWDEIAAEKLFSQPSIADFIRIPAGSKMTESELLGMIPFPLISYTFNPGNGNIVAHHSLKTFLSSDDYAKIAPCLTDSLVYQPSPLKYKLLK